MSHRSSDPHDTADGHGDLIDAIPALDRATTQVERSFGPSCLLSLVIVFLLLVILRRYVRFGWIGTGILALVVWYAVFALLVRWRSDRVQDEEERRW